MRTLALALGALSLLAGCASSPTLPYAPLQQPPGAKISAGYQIAGDTLRFEVDTDHRRLEEARIVKADGTEVRAVNIENPPLVTSAPSSSFGFGIGGISGGGGSGVGVGTGVSVGGPVGSPTTTIEGHTFVSFPLSQSGSAPWSLQLRLAGTPPIVILVGGP
jgi:hypothetical protein